MAWGLPDAGEGDSNIQSILFQEYLDVLIAGLAGIDLPLSGLDVTGGADLTPAVAKGAVLSNRLLLPVTAGDVTISAAHATLPRIDLIVVTSAGAKAVRTGTAAANPKPPARSANDVVIAAVYVPATDTAIAQSQIVDLRAPVPRSTLLHKTTTAETTNTTAAAIHLLNKAGSGLVIPSGLFTAGKLIRCRMGGDMSMNSGTPTGTLTILYGGSTLFADVTSTGWTADADRRAWFVEFDLVAQANADQALVGAYNFQGAAGHTAAATGRGDIGGTSEQVGPLAGSAAVDSDAADRTLAVTFTMSVSNVANEIVVDSCTVELLN